MLTLIGYKAVVHISNINKETLHNSVSLSGFISPAVSGTTTKKSVENKSIHTNVFLTSPSFLTIYVTFLILNK